jgi:hypothetical protein
MSPLSCNVAISVSDPEPEELARNGVGRGHVRHAFVELTRQILAAGGGLSYGGDLRREGYTDTLAALLHTYSQDDRPEAGRVHQYLTRNAIEEASEESVAELNAIAEIVVVESEAEEEPLRQASALSQLRLMMSETTQARVSLGGRLQGQTGRWPGIVEEAAFAIRNGQPLFVLGGLGGAADRLARALQGDWPEELTDDFQYVNTEVYADLAEAGHGPEEDELRELLTGADPANGLSAEENAELRGATDLDQIAALVMRGLTGLDPENAFGDARRISRRRFSV